jgi:hypothetical protein
LVNFKSYHYIAITYGYNNFQRFVLNTNPLTGIQSSTGQAFPYVAGRKAAFGAIRSYVGIPHKPTPQDGGTVQNSQFGDLLSITRLEGQGNGRNGLELEKVSEDAIMSGFPWRSDRLTYKRGRGPIEVRIVDPLRVPDAQFEVWFRDSTAAANLNRAHWFIVNLSTHDTIFSDRTIDLRYEQLLLDWGLSVTIGQTPAMLDGLNFPYTEPIGQGRMTFTDPSKAWLTGIPDADGAIPSNWVRSGTSVFPAPDVAYSDRAGRDDAQVYEGILGGTWAPWVLVGHAPFQPSNTQQSTL